MTNRLISKYVDIYRYPEELESNLGSITLGDLHGNPIKLIHFLFRYQIIQFKNDVADVQETYQQFVTLYEQYGELIEEYQEYRTLLHFAQIKINNAMEQIEILDKQLLEVKEMQQYPKVMQLYLQLTNKLKKAQEEQVSLMHQLNKPQNKLTYYINQFNQFMKQLKIRNNKTMIRLIGDEVSDRGNCDYFTLRIIDFIYRKDCPLTILISNHGSEFIYGYEHLIAGHPFVPQGYIGDFQIPSFWGLKYLLEQEVVTQDELINLVNHSYKPTLKILDYTLSEKGITLFSHAPIRFDAIQLMAERLGITYDDATIEVLATTIDQINFQFQSYVNNNTIHQLFNTDTIIDRTNMTKEEKAAWPLIYLFWNRWNESKETADARPAIKNDFHITYVHGHDPFQSNLSHVHNIDTLCGKEPRKKNAEQIKHIAKIFDSDEYAYKTKKKIRNL